MTFFQNPVTWTFNFQPGQYLKILDLNFLLIRRGNLPSSQLTKLLFVHVRLFTPRFFLHCTKGAPSQCLELYGNSKLHKHRKVYYGHMCQKQSIVFGTTLKNMCSNELEIANSALWLCSATCFCLLRNLPLKLYNIPE